MPMTDAQGNIIRDKEGKTTPRFTTLFDAAREAARAHPEYRNEIPILCHQEHLRPVAVCRICMVEVRGKERRENGLVPACQFRVKEGLDVHTHKSSDPDAVKRITNTVRVLTELLTADHLPPQPPGAVEDDGQGFNELTNLARQFAPNGSRFVRRSIERGHDDSSLVIAVNHDSCILCDRCVRACTDVKHNNIIGRTGKGYTTHIGFDLNDKMGKSDCVSCGECMITCPTDALTFRSQVAGQKPQSSRDAVYESVDPADLRREHPLFRALPYKFLQWDARSVWRRRLRAGEPLCEEGEYGNTAFILVRGKFGVYASGTAGAVVTERATGFRGFFGRLNVRLKPTAGQAGAGTGDQSPNSRYGRLVATNTPDDLILGEMTCMNNSPRAATVVALEDSEVFEIGRNVLFLMQRHPGSREILNKTYREHVLERELRSIPLLSAVSDAVRRECVAFLAPRVDLVRLDPGQVIFKQGELADDFYMVRLGFVKVSQKFERGEWVRDYLGPRRHFGEIGLLSKMTGGFQEQVPAPIRGRRTATCTALDHVELLRIKGDDFISLLATVPALDRNLQEYARGRLQADADRAKLLDQPLDNFLEQGLFQGQSLLVLDLENCTRCDECTKACADTHDGVTRLIREGLRFDNFLVASSCRSCIDPYCLVGCPVDAIHRNDTLQIRIEDHCIGCGLCAQNCPYGNINMHGFPEKVPDPDHPGKRLKVIRHKATTCDLCSHITTDHHQAPSCVFACPHNAAFRMTGPELRQVVEHRREIL
jgi:Fe-S-cluster-containing hydrogenase component 2